MQTLEDDGGCPREPQVAIHLFRTKAHETLFSSSLHTFLSQFFSREVSLTCERSLSSYPALLLPAHFSSPVFGQAAAWQRTK